MYLQIKVILFYRKADSVALRSDCADAQTDLKLHWPHMSEDPFSHDAAQMILNDNRSGFELHSDMALDLCLCSMYYIDSKNRTYITESNN